VTEIPPESSATSSSQDEAIGKSNSHPTDSIQNSTTQAIEPAPTQGYDTGDGPIQLSLESEDERTYQASLSAMVLRMSEATVSRENDPTLPTILNQENQEFIISKRF